MNTQMNSAQIIAFANKVTELCLQFGKTIKLHVVKIKVVGSQSAGKSTLIWRIIGYDILPMGDNMVTRTPVYLRSHQLEQGDMTTIKLSYLKNAGLSNACIEEVFMVKFFDTDPDAIEKQQQFKQQVIALTDNITKGKFKISRTPIFVDISSPKVMNLSFVDLPGLIVANSNKEQPIDLRDQIDDLVKQELLEPNTIALVVSRSGVDLVTDLGIGIVASIKDFIASDSKFHTVGVLTKPDLLDGRNRSDLNFIVGNKAVGGARPLEGAEVMSEGYFVVNNNVENIEAEENFFTNNFDPSREILANKRYGVTNLKQHLQAHLVDAITDMMPIIKETLNEILRTQRQRAAQLGREMESDYEKMSYAITTFSEISRLFTSSLKNEDDNNIDVGPKIREIQKIFYAKIATLNPFSFDKMSNEELQLIIDKFNGWDMASNATLQQLVTKCIKNPTKRPIMLIKPVSEEFVRSVGAALIYTIDQLLATSPSVGSLQSYTKFRNLIAVTISTHIKKLEAQVNSYINHTLTIKEDVVWSSGPEFREVFGKHYFSDQIEKDKKQEKQPPTFKSASAVQSIVPSRTSSDNNLFFQYSNTPTQLRELATIYYTDVIRTMSDTINQTVISQIINVLKRTLPDVLTNLITQTPSSDDQPTAITCIVENANTAADRKLLNDNISRLEKALKLTIKCEM